MIDDLLKRLWKGIADIDQQQEAAATIEAVTAKNTALRADNDRLRGAVSDLLSLMADDEGPEIDAARAALDASK